MKPFVTLARTEFRLFLREPAAVFFTIAFPLMLLFLFGSMYGNDPANGFNGRGSVDISVPGYLAMIIATTTIMTIPIVVSEYRNKGIFRRLRATPIQPATILGAQAVIYLFVTAIGMVLLYIAGKLVYDLATPESPLALVGVLLLSFAMMASIGFLIASVFSSSRTAQVVGNIVYFPQIFLAGAAIPRELLSDTMRKWTEWIPLTQSTKLIKAAWFGDALNGWSIVYLLIVTVICLGISIRLFRWE